MAMPTIFARTLSEKDAEAYAAGRDAALRGVDYKANPHPSSSLLSIAWDHGWTRGRDQSALERHGLI
jgi:hypothetical protein